MPTFLNNYNYNENNASHSQLQVQNIQFYFNAKLSSYPTVGVFNLELIFLYDFQS